MGEVQHDGGRDLTSTFGLHRPVYTHVCMDTSMYTHANTFTHPYTSHTCAKKKGIVW